MRIEHANNRKSVEKFINIPMGTIFTGRISQYYEDFNATNNGIYLSSAKGIVVLEHEDFPCGNTFLNSVTSYIHDYKELDVTLKIND